MAETKKSEGVKKPEGVKKHEEAKTPRKKAEKKRRKACICGSEDLFIHKDELGNETGTVSCNTCRRRYVTKGFLFPLYPDSTGLRRMFRFGHADRFAWNWIWRLVEQEYEEALRKAGVFQPWSQRPKTRAQYKKLRAEKRFAYKQLKEQGKKLERPQINGGRLYQAFCDFRDKDPKGAWIRHEKIHSHVYSTPIRNFVKSYKAFWKARSKGKKAGAPRYKRRGSELSFTIQIHNKHVRSWGIDIPGIGVVPTRRYGKDKHGHRYRKCGRDPAKLCANGEVCSVTVRYKAGQWTASVTMRDVLMPIPDKATEGPVGLDFGRHNFVTWACRDAIGMEEPPNGRALERHLQKLKRLQRQVQRKKPGSHRSQRHALKIARLHMKIARIRGDYLHKLSKDLVMRHQHLQVEGFDIKKMVSEEVGYRKDRRRIMDGAWGIFRNNLRYKSEWYDREFTKHDEFDRTDQECWICGTMNKMPNNTSKYTCTGCGNSTTRQVNTARLLERKGFWGPLKPSGSTPGVGGTHARLKNAATSAAPATTAPTGVEGLEVSCSSRELPADGLGSIGSSQEARPRRKGTQGRNVA